MTDVGRIRSVNEDSCYVNPDLNGFLLAIVADGMGGHQAGDTASQMATRVISEHLQPVYPEMPQEELTERLQEAVVLANQNIFELASDKTEYFGMGTTVVVALASPQRLYIAHIGDSRAYLLADGLMEQLTEDHSLVNELVKSGQITKKEAEKHPRRNVLTRALGTELEVAVDIHTYDWKAGDTVLICSDGLTGQLSSVLLERIVLSPNDDLEQKSQKLIDGALEAGGDDNVTVVLITNDDMEEEKGDEA